MPLSSLEGESTHKQVRPMPISNTLTSRAVHDEQTRPIIFSIGSEGGLFALLPHGTSGQAMLLDLHPLFGLASSAVVSTLSVLQDKQLNIYLTFAVNGSKPGDHSSLYVVRPTQPTEWLAASKDPKSAPHLLKDMSNEKRLVKRLYLAGSPDPASAYPPLVVVYSQPDGSGINAACLDINVPNGGWKYSHSFELPVIPENMIDMCAGTLPGGINGLFCLYDNQGMRLTFSGAQSDAHHQTYFTSLNVPPGAKSLTTFVNPQGFTDLLVGGTAVTHYPSTLAVHSDPPGGPDRFAQVTKDQDPYFYHVSQLTVAQSRSHDALSIYGRNADDIVVYQKCTLLDSIPTKPSLDGPSISLPRHSQDGGHFTVLLDAATSSRKLFIVGEGEPLTRMQQSGGTHLWERISVLVPSTGENKEITHTHVTDSHGAPVANAKFLLCNSYKADLGSNGSSVSITPDDTSKAQWYEYLWTAISVENSKAGVLVIKDVHIESGRTFQISPWDKGKEVPSPGGQKIQEGNTVTFGFCGRTSSPTGTSGNFSVWDDKNNFLVATYSWNNPYSGTNAFDNKFLDVRFTSAVDKDTGKSELGHVKVVLGKK